jgi:hypothetical protein
VAVANELVIAHPRGQTSVIPSLLLFGGPLLPAVADGLSVGGRCHGWSAYAALGLVAALLLVLVVIVVRERDVTASRLLAHGRA